MNDIQLYQFEPEEPLLDEDDSQCFRKKPESPKKARGEPGTLTGELRALNFSPSRLRICHPVHSVLQ